MSQDYYIVLGVNRDAAPDEIRKAYRRLARELHPDINPDPQTQERFKKISEAYEVLSKPEKRQMYDLGYITSADGVTHWVNATPGGVSRDFARATAGKSNAEKQEILDMAARNNDLDLMNFLLLCGVVPAKKTLQYAVERKALQWVEVFAKKGAQLTPEMLDIAARNDDADIMNFLMQHGVVPAEKTLQYAVERKALQWVEVFAKKGAQLTPEMLDIAARNDDADIMNFLMQHGVVPAEKTLQYAVERKALQWVEVFAKKGAQLTPEMLDIAARNDDADIMNFLMQHGVVPAEKTLQYAVERKALQWVVVFAKKGAQLTPEMLDIAARNDDADIMNFLMQHGVVPAEKTLQYAVERKILQWVDAFIKKGATPTPEMVDIAKRNNDTAMVDILQMALANAPKPSLGGAVSSIEAACALTIFREEQ